MLFSPPLFEIPRDSPTCSFHLPCAKKIGELEYAPFNFPLRESSEFSKMLFTSPRRENSWLSNILLSTPLSALARSSPLC
ncbi:hypothetical protein DPMN_179776 [Dreissena polymorpha]|uniref:Uncharacterized protein n=1 Tax=Dreissena polymorpha TaxID=45954 RepID=A0A9D4EEM6_DREPO|nr:hypothetical protein DPMN_179776 [Dreissena polymorpha]